MSIVQLAWSDGVRSHSRGHLIARAGVALVASALVALPTPSWALRQALGRPDTIRVLLIGNSFTYYNDMPRILEAVAASRPGPVIQTTMIARGGATLQDHWLDTAARARLQQRPRWDWVVLNEQSTFGEAYFVDGRPRVHGWAQFARYASRCAARAQAHGARVALLLHWADRGAPSRDQAAIDYAVARVARAIHATVVPTGTVWQTVARAHPDLDLYDPDGHHPSPAGSYLLATTLYATLVGRSPIGAADTVRGPAVEPSDGRVYSDSIVVLVALPVTQAALLQRAAWSMHRQLAEDGGRIGAGPPTAIAVPTLPSGGVHPTPTQLAGIWRGVSTLYPSPGPAPTELWVGVKGDSLWGRIRVVLGPRPAQVHEGPVSVTITDHGVELTDPEGPNGGTVRYRGLVRGGLVQGVADFIVPDPMVHGIGTWTLHHDN